MLVREERLVFAELKKDGGYASAAQREWLDLLTASARRTGDDVLPKWEVYLWKPADWSDIEVVLW